MTGQEIINPNGSAEILPAAPRAALTPMEILQSAVQGGASVDALEKLLALQERWQENEAKKAFDQAIALAKNEIPPIKKNRRVKFENRNGGNTDYAHEDLAEIARTVNPILSKHGLSYRWRTDSPPDGPVKVTCVISHAMGYCEENSLEGPRDTTGNKNTLQGIGSTVTFLERYTLKAALGLVTDEDDDGRAAGPPVREPRPEVKRETKPAMSQKTADQIARFVAETKTDLLNCESEADVEKAWAKRRQKLEDLRKIDPETAERVDHMRVKRIADFTGEVIDDFPGDRAP